MHITTNEPKSVQVMSVERLIERLSKYQKIYPGALVAMNEHSGSLDFFEGPGAELGCAHKYLAQFLFE